MAAEVVFILGAGASCSYGLPLGSELMAHMCQALCDEPTEHEYFRARRMSPDRERALRMYEVRRAGPESSAAAQTIVRELPGSASIDNYLFYRGNDDHIRRLGKLGIVDAISHHEALSNLVKLDDDRDGPKVNCRWLGDLVAMLRDDIRREDVETFFDPIAIVNFNYDRVVEHVLYHRIQPKLGIGPKEAASVMKGLRIWRPYGWLGPLPWQDPLGHAFGAHEVNLADLAEGIRTFTEGPLVDLENLPWQPVIEKARLIVFLGFGFHKQNVEMLTRSPGNADVVFTCKGMTDPSIRAAQKAIRTQLVHLNGNPDQVQDGVNETCEGFMSLYRGTIASYWQR